MCCYIYFFEVEQRYTAWYVWQATFTQNWVHVQLVPCSLHYLFHHSLRFSPDTYLGIETLSRMLTCVKNNAGAILNTLFSINSIKAIKNRKHFIVLFFHPLIFQNYWIYSTVAFGFTWTPFICIKPRQIITSSMLLYSINNNQYLSWDILNSKLVNFHKDINMQPMQSMVKDEYFPNP